jgi:hypothetical protein
VLLAIGDEQHEIDLLSIDGESSSLTRQFICMTQRARDQFAQFFYY